MGAVKNALQRDGKDPSIMDLDPNRSIKSQAGGSDDNDDSPLLKDDPEYEKVSICFVRSPVVAFLTLETVLQNA